MQVFMFFEQLMGFLTGCTNSTVGTTKAVLNSGAGALSGNFRRQADLGQPFIRAI
jgi:hypothetical protein